MIIDIIFFSYGRTLLFLTRRHKLSSGARTESPSLQAEVCVYLCRGMSVCCLCVFKINFALLSRDIVFQAGTK